MDYPRSGRLRWADPLRPTYGCTELRYPCDPCRSRIGPVLLHHGSPTGRARNLSTISRPKYRYHSSRVFFRCSPMAQTNVMFSSMVPALRSSSMIMGMATRRWLAACAPPLIRSGKAMTTFLPGPPSSRRGGNPRGASSAFRVASNRVHFGGVGVGLTVAHHGGRIGKFHAHPGVSVFQDHFLHVYSSTFPGLDRTEIRYLTNFLCETPDTISRCSFTASSKVYSGFQPISRRAGPSS